ncbi:hypothetical protein LTS18_008595, partial [Coniosporium uncinatum]
DPPSKRKRTRKGKCDQNSKPTANGGVTSSTFLQLPAELRLQIYEGVLYEDDEGRDVEVMNFVGCDFDTFAILDDHLLQFNVQVRSEATSQWVQTHRFIIASGPALEWFNGWLEHLYKQHDIKARNQVRNLYFRNFGFFSKTKYGSINGDIELMKSCPFLKNATIRFHVAD